MELNTEQQLVSIVQVGKHKVLSPMRNNSRIVLSKLKKAKGTLESCNGYAVFIPLKGEKVYDIGSRQFHVRPGKYVLLNHDQPCELVVDSGEESVGLNVRLNRQYVDEAYYVHRNQTDKLLTDPYPYIRSNSEIMQGEYYLNENVLGTFIQNILNKLDVEHEKLQTDENELFVELAQNIMLMQLNISKEIENIPALKNTTRIELYKRLCKARALILDNLSTGLDIATISKEIAVSEAHFQRSFKQTFGITPHQYFLRKKIDIAAEKIKKTNIPLSDIAFHLGYNDLSSFNRNFKRAYGVSPKYYRKEAR